MLAFTRSSSLVMGRVPETQFGQIVGDGGIQPRRLGLLGAQLGRQAPHLVLERFVVLGLGFRAHVAAGSEHVAVLADLVQAGRLAEAGDVLVGARLGLAAPGVVGAGDARDVRVRQFAVGAVHQLAQLAGVDEEQLVLAIAEAAVGLAP